MRVFIRLLLILCLVSFASTEAKKKKAAAIDFSTLSNVLSNEFIIGIDQADFSQDLSQEGAHLRLYFDPTSLAVSDTFPQIIKIEVYKTVNGDDELITVANQSYKNFKKLKDTIVNIPLPLLSSSSDLNIKVYNSAGSLAGEFQTSVSLQNAPSSGGVGSSESVTCPDGFGECQMDYIMQNLNIVTVNNRQPATIITKEQTGEYTARIPLTHQARKKVKTVNKIKGKAGGSAIDLAEGRIQFEDNNRSLKAEMGWDPDSDSLKISFPGSDKTFTFSEEGLTQSSNTTISSSTEEESSSIELEDGDASQVPIKINPGDLSANLVDGAIEYDGNSLYFTSHGSRRTLGTYSTTLIGGSGGSGGTGSSLTGPNNALMVKVSANNLVGTSDLQFVANTLSVNNSIVFQSLNAENYTGAETLDWTTGNQKRITLDGDTTLTFVAPSGYCNLLLEINQDATGSRTITWPASVLWPGGFAPTLSTAANAIDVVTCFYNGTNYLCQSGLDFQ